MTTLVTGANASSYAAGYAKKRAALLRPFSQTDKLVCYGLNVAVQVRAALSVTLALSELPAEAQAWLQVTPVAGGISVTDRTTWVPCGKDPAQLAGVAASAIAQLTPDGELLTLP